jgi:hypothetical protein
LRSLSENTFKFGDAKISASIPRVKSSLISLNDGRVKDDRVEPLLVVDDRLEPLLVVDDQVVPLLVVDVWLNDELGFLPTFDWSVM